MAHATSSQPFPVSFLIPSSFHSHLPAYKEGTECSETSAYKIQMPGYCLKEIMQNYFLVFQLILNAFKKIDLGDRSWESSSSGATV
jgi:hypothetical protein